MTDQSKTGRETMTDDRVRVRPREGARIRDEFTYQPIPEGGATVKRTRHVQRLIDAGDLVEDSGSDEQRERFVQPYDLDAGRRKDGDQ